MNNGTKSNTRLEEPDRGFERPLPKVSHTLFNQCLLSADHYFTVC